jgi:ABC-type amino acid transport substrate-binding protein
MAALAVVIAVLVAACGGGSSSSDSSASETTEGTAAANTETVSSSAPVKAPESLVNGGKITFGTDFTFPPYESIENGEQKGFDVEVAQLLGETLGLETEMIDTRFSVLIPGLEAHHYDAILSAIYITPERLEAVDMVPYFNTGNVIVVKEDGDYQPQTPIEICGHTFSVNSGAFVESVIENEVSKECEEKGLGSIDVQTLPTETANYEQVASGRSDVILSDTAVTAAQLKAEPQLGLHVSSAPGKLFYSTPGGIAVPKGEEELFNALTEAVEYLEGNGKLEALRKKYALAPADPAQVKQAEEEAR